MTPEEFIDKWGPGGPAYDLNERQGAQSFFLDLCEVLDVPKPGTAKDYLFEKNNLVLGETRGYADVFMRDHFAWENKAPGKNLDTALKQLLPYALALGNPPLLVVSDRLVIRIHTQFNGHPSVTHTILLQELARPEQRTLLKHLWADPEQFRPKETTRDITEAAARSFATLADQLRERGNSADKVAHFLTQCLFCFFAEDVQLLPGRMFERLVNNRQLSNDLLTNGLTSLFLTMRTGGLYGPDNIPWFNGGLFKVVDVPELGTAEITELRNSASLNWSAIDVSIFGTLFERGLDPSKRSQLGAHYTDPATIERLIDPLIRRPLLQDWESAAKEIRVFAAKVKKKGDKQYRDAHTRFITWLERLRSYRVLDPACGSGNFLFLALKALKNIEHQSHVDAAAMGLDREQDLVTGPQNILGIELNEYAAELARVTVWIGELQWRIDHGYAFKTNPVLEPLDHIECRDALLILPEQILGVRGKAVEAQWPDADVAIGNPPFIGDKKMRGELGSDYVDKLHKVYQGRIPGGADLVTYWFEKARRHIETGKIEAAGLVATNSIRGGANRKVLDRIADTTRIFEAWSDEDWVNEGAAVRVSLVAFGKRNGAILNGKTVASIHTDLTADVDVTNAPKISENLGVSFQGVTPSASVNKRLRDQLGLPEASFNLSGSDARKILREPATANGEPMSAVVRPYLIADDITTRPLDRFIVNFVGRDEMGASMFEKPFKAISKVRLHRQHTGRFNDFEKYPWWQFGWPRPVMFRTLSSLQRYISIPRVAKHHLCVWTSTSVVPGDAIVVVAREDDTSIGILQSRIHEVWALRTGTSLEDRPRYTHTTCFESFPFPDGLSPNTPASNYADNKSAKRIAAAAHNLIKLRDHYLNPPEWVEWFSTPEEVAAGFPKHPIAKAGFETELKRRTLTNLYNERPVWLDMAHKELDGAVATAYGWMDYTPEMSDEEILTRLVALNLKMAGT